MTFQKQHRRKKKPQPLDRAALEQLALNYVARYATSRKKLTQYLQRKLHERGWVNDAEADPHTVIEAMLEDFTNRRYLDDETYGQSVRLRAIERGYGERRMAQALFEAGLKQDEKHNFLFHYNEEERRYAALRFAYRRKVGPFSVQNIHALTPDERQRIIVAGIRAGHNHQMIEAILSDDYEQILQEAESLGVTKR